MKSTMFAQTLQLLPWGKIQKCIDNKHGDKHSKGLRTQDQLKAMFNCHLYGCQPSEILQHKLLRHHKEFLTIKAAINFYREFNFANSIQQLQKKRENYD